MVDPSMPWSLKGISDEAREFAKLSADNSDVPVGAWLSQVIRAASGTATIEPSEETVIDSPPPQWVSDFADWVDAHLETGDTDEGPARDADLIEDPVILQAELLALERRLENAESNTQDSLAPLVDEIDRIRARLDDTGNT